MYRPNHPIRRPHPNRPPPIIITHPGPLTGPYRPPLRNPPPIRHPPPPPLRRKPFIDIKLPFIHIRF